MHWAISALLLSIRSLPFLVLTQTSSFFPEQIKLSWTANENEMAVTWVTYLPTESYVRFSPILCSLSGEIWQIEGQSVKFNAGTDAVPRIQFIHRAVIAPVLNECHYQYQVGNRLYWSQAYVFRGRTVDSEEPYDTSPVTLIILGDLGTGPVAVGTKELLYRESEAGMFDGVLHLGDIAYNLYSEFGHVGDTFMNMIQPIAARFPYMVLPGNHENNSNSTHYKARFTMPYNEYNQGTGYFYSLDIGPMHLITLNTDTIIARGREDLVQVMMNWFYQDLEKASKNRAVRPWLVVTTHHPIYCTYDYITMSSEPQCTDESVMFQEIFEETLMKYKVDLVLTAHVHNYERDSPIYKNETVLSEIDEEFLHVNPRAPIHIMSGNAGNWENTNDPISRTPQEWTRVLSQTFGYGHLKVINSTHLYWEQVSSPSMELIDHLWIVKDEI